MVKQAVKAGLRWAGLLEPVQRGIVRAEVSAARRRRKRVRDRVRGWVRRSLDVVCANGSASDFVFSGAGAFVRTDCGAEFLWDPQIADGGLLELQYAEGHEAAERRILASLLPDDGVFLDVGACFGLYSVELALQRPGLRGFAFEPTERGFDLLRRNLAHNKLEDRITPVRAAVSDACGEARVTAVQYSGDHLVTAGDADVPVERVPGVTIDAFVRGEGIGRVAAIKVDVEGAELLVLRGAADVLRRDRPVLHLEVWPRWLERFGHTAADVLGFLEDLDYMRLMLPASDAAERPQDCNFVFVPREARAPDFQELMAA